MIASIAAACASPPPEPPPDPCPALYREYVAARADACTADADCAHVSGIAPRPADQSVMGARDGRPCGSSARRDAAPAVERVVERYRAAACGPIGPPGSRACNGLTHGADPICMAGHCQFPY